MCIYARKRVKLRKWIRDAEKKLRWIKRGSGGDRRRKER